MSKNNKFNFVDRFTGNEHKRGDNDDLKYNPPKKMYKFYQICSFKNPNTGYYDVRIVVFNELAEIVRSRVYMFPTKECNALIKKLKSNEYKIYPTYDIDIIDVPQMNDLLILQSPLLSG